MKKNIVIDDFGRTPNVSLNILKIINDIAYISEVSVMMGFVTKDLHTKLINTKVRTSLHLNLTDNVYFPDISKKNLTFIKLLFLPKKKREFVFKEIDNQINKYQEIYNLDKIIINGHEHVHSIPWIYEYLYKNTKIKNIRYNNEKLAFILNKNFNLLLIRNYIAFFVLKFINLFNIKKSDDLFFGVIYTNFMCIKVYNKIINNYNDPNLKILFHPGKATKEEKKFFLDVKYFKYFTSIQRDKELKELYEIKKNTNSH